MKRSNDGPILVRVVSVPARMMRPRMANNSAEAAFGIQSAQ
jgi:hypothetical protein